MKFTVGDIIKITKEGSHEFELGDRCVVVERSLDSTKAKVRKIGTGIQHTISDEEATLVASVERDAPDPIYTRDEAAALIELFEDILEQNEISVPSPEDDDRDPDNMIGLYGSTYFVLLDDVEVALQDLLNRHTSNTEIIIDEFSGTA